jgi:hypothetical protein
LIRIFQHRCWAEHDGAFSEASLMLHDTFILPLNAAPDGGRFCFLNGSMILLHSSKILRTTVKDRELNLQWTMSMGAGQRMVRATLFYATYLKLKYLNADPFLLDRKKYVVVYLCGWYSFAPGVV